MSDSIYRCKIEYQETKVFYSQEVSTAVISHDFENEKNLISPVKSYLYH